MNSAANALLGEIESYCRSSGIAESTFGKLVVNDGKLCTRLREGKNVTLDTADRIKSYIHEHQPAQGKTPSGVLKGTKR